MSRMKEFFFSLWQRRHEGSGRKSTHRQSTIKLLLLILLSNFIFYFCFFPQQASVSEKFTSTKCAENSIETSIETEEAKEGADDDDEF